MANVIKQSIFIFLLLAVGFYAYANLPVKELARNALIEYFARQGIAISQLEIDTLSPIGAEISHIEIASPSRVTIGMVRVNVLENSYEVENLRIPGFMNGQDAAFNIKFRLGFSGEKMGVVCDVAGQPQDMAAHFTLFPAHKKSGSPQVHLDNASMRWREGGLLSVVDVDFPLTPVAPVLFSLRLSGVSLDAVLKMVISPQAQATGSISGVIPLEYSYGQLRVLGVDLSTRQPGLFRLVSGPVPGATPEQLAMLNTLSYFQYTRLMLSTMGNPPMLVLRIEGKNPAQASAGEVKLQFNAGPAGLDALNRALGASQAPLPVPQTH